jgi:sugar/nucleoside kinase (ribokinase family)
VLEQFQPAVPHAHRDSPYVLLANISPAIQHAVLSQMSRPRFVIADTMDLWMNIALADLLKLLRRVDALVLNDSEARQLSGLDNLIAAARKLHKLGPKFIIIKKGEHGAILSGPGGLFLSPAYPLKKVVDPTGAGDSFVGGLIGYLASTKGPLEKNLRRALVYGSAVASFNCEGFGLNRITKVTRKAIDARVKELEILARF